MGSADSSRQFGSAMRNWAGDLVLLETQKGVYGRNPGFGAEQLICRVK